MPENETSIPIHQPEDVPLGYEPIAELSCERTARDYAAEAVRVHRRVLLVKHGGGVFSVWVELHVFWLD